MKRNKSFLLVSATVLFWALGLEAAVAADVEGHKTIAGLSVYLGVLPAAMVRDHSGDRTEAAMHGGIPRGHHALHVMAAVFDAKTGERVEDARVKARVSPPGLAGETRALEPMAIAGTITYGNYFTTIGDRHPYRIRLSITLAGTATPVVVEFSHRRRPR
jgi:hypothetical protein